MTLPGILVSAVAVLMLYWTETRLNCIFYSAFEYAQAAIIHDHLSWVGRCLGVQHCLYRCYFDRWHFALLAYRMTTILMLGLQVVFAITERPHWILTADNLYLVVTLIVVACWYLLRKTGRDGKKYAEYNAFAPLHEPHQREIRLQRNAMRLTQMMQRMSLGGFSGIKLSTDDRLRIAERYKNK